MNGIGRIILKWLVQNILILGNLAKKIIDGARRKGLTPRASFVLLAGLIMRNDYKRLLEKTKYTSRRINAILNKKWNNKRNRRLCKWQNDNYKWAIKEANVIIEKYPKDNES